MSTNKLKFIAKTLLKENFTEFENFLAEKQQFDLATFLKRNKKIFIEIFDIDYVLEQQGDLPDAVVFLAVAIKNKVMMTVDWSGEEFSGQVKRGITQMIKQQKLQTIKWKNRNLEREILELKPKRGDFLPLLFRELNKELESEMLSIGFFECGDDAYHFFVISSKEFEQIFNIEENDFSILDTNIYNMYITEIGVNTSKVMIYLKNKFNIPLAEIKSFMNQDKILIGTGNMMTINLLNKELENLDVKIEIKKCD